MQLMDPLAAAMMTGEVLTNPLHVAALLMLSPPSGAGPHFVDDLFREAMMRTEQIDPRMCRRPHIGLDTMGLWTWQDVDVELTHHVQRRILPGGSDERALWHLIADLHAQPLDRSRPQWMAYLIDGLPGGRFAFYVKVHHTLIDGVAGMQMIMDTLSTDPDCGSMPPFYAVGPRQAEGDTGSGRLPDPAAVLRSAVGAATASIGLTRNIVSGSTDYLLAALRRQSPFPLTAPFTRFNARLGPQRAVAGATVSLQRIIDIKEAADVSFNDVLTAVISGVLRGWLAAHDELPDRSLVGICPITLRADGDSAQSGPANLFGIQQCVLGTDLADPAQRLATIHKSMRWAKEQVARSGSGVTALLAVPNLAPSLLLSMLPLLPRWRTGYNLPISNIRGPTEDRYFNGAHLDSVYPISTVFDGLGLNATMFSYAGRVSIGYVAGRNLVPDIQTLIALTETALAELEMAVGLG